MLSELTQHSLDDLDLDFVLGAHDKIEVAAFWCGF
jgi:hypothetical protein